MRQRKRSMLASSQPEVVMLCVEREPRETIAHWLSVLKIAMVAASDGYHANALLKVHPVRLLIVDRLLPPWPGLDTPRQLIEAKPDLRLAFIDDGSRNAAALARACGVHSMLNRPLTRNQVVAALGGVGLVS
jgi:DNA-binding response OmpR family regulator